MVAKRAYSAKDMGGNRVVNLGQPQAANDAARLTDVQQAQSSAQSYADSLFDGLASGQHLKGTVRAALTGNVDLSAPGATLDGLSASSGDLFLLTGQTTGAENGPYEFNGAAAPMTRATNWDTAGEAVVGSYWIVSEGTHADQFALLTNDVFTLGTTTGTFTFVGASAAGPSYSSMAADSPAIPAGGSGAITHNFGTRDVGWAVRRVASPYDYVEIRVEADTENTIALRPDVAVAAGELRVLVWQVG